MQTQKNKIIIASDLDLAVRPGQSTVTVDLSQSPGPEQSLMAAEPGQSLSSIPQLGAAASSTRTRLENLAREASKNSEAADTSLKRQKKLEVYCPREGGMDGEFTRMIPFS